MLRLHLRDVAMRATHSFLPIFETSMCATPLVFFYNLDFRKMQNRQSVSANFEYEHGFYVLF